MFTYIGKEIKEHLFSVRSILIIVMLFIISISKVNEHNQFYYLYKWDHMKNESKNEYEVAYMLHSFYNEKIRFGTTIEDEKIIETYDLLLDTCKEMDLAIQKKDLKTFNEKYLLTQLIRGSGSMREEFLDFEKDFFIDTEDLLVNLSGGYKYEDLEMDTEIDTSLGSKLYNYSKIRKAINIYENNSYHLGRSQIDGFRFLYIYLGEILSTIIIVSIIILFFDNIARDIHNGNIKMSLSMLRSREKYLISKIISSFISIIIIILAVGIVMTFLVGIRFGFASRKEATLYYEGNMSFKPIYNTLDSAIKDPQELVGVDGISSYKYRDDSGVEAMGVRADVNYITMDKTLLISLLYIVGIVTFYVIYINLISSISRNRIINLFIAFVLFLLPSVLSKQLLPSGDYLNISPFSIDNPTRILSGNYNITLMFACIIILVSIIVSFTISNIYFKNKDL